MSRLILFNKPYGVLSQFTDRGSDGARATLSDHIDIPKEKLLQLIRNLPDGYRLVFNMYAIEKYSHKQIAETLQIEEGTSKSQLFKARKMLQKEIIKLQQNINQRP